MGRRRGVAFAVPAVFRYDGVLPERRMDPLLKYFSSLPLAVALVLSASAAQTTLRDRYPVGGFKSVDQAAQAVLAAQAERARVEAEFIVQRRLCHQTFLTTSCLLDIEGSRREHLAAANAVEVEANRFRREAQSAERERKLAEDERQRVLDAPQDAIDRAAKVRAYNQKLADHAQRERERLVEAAAAVPTPPERAEQRAQRLAEREAELTKKEEDAAARGAQRQARADSVTRRIREREVESARKEKEQADQAAERQLLARQQAQKIRDAEIRQANTAKKRAENEARRAQERKDAAAAAVPAPAAR